MAEFSFITAQQGMSTPRPLEAPMPRGPHPLQVAGAGLQEIAEKFQVARRQREVSALTLEATKRLADLEIEFEKDTDFKTAPQRFQQASAKIKDELGRGTSDSVVRSIFQTRFSELAIAKTVNVRKGAWLKEKDAAQATLDDSIETYSRLYADSQNQVEKDLIREQAEQTIVGAGESGWISREEAGKRRRLFESRATEAEIAKLGRNPAAAEKIVERLIAGDFKGLDPVARERQIRTWQARADAYDRKVVASSERADRSANKELKKRSDEAQKDHMVKAMNGTLTVQDVLSQQHVMEPEAFKASLRMAREGDGVTDRDIDINLTTRLGTEDISKDANRAYAAGTLSQARYNALMSANERAMSDTRPGTPFKTLRANISGRLKPSELSYSPVQAKLQQDGLREWDDWNRDNPEATKEQMDGKADEIIRRYSQIQVGEMAAATPLPRHYTGDAASVIQRPQDALPLLEGTARRVLEDLDAKRISQTQADRELRDIQVLEDAAKRALLNQSRDDKKGRK